MKAGWSQRTIGFLAYPFDLCPRPHFAPRRPSASQRCWNRRAHNQTPIPREILRKAKRWTHASLIPTQKRSWECPRLQSRAFASHRANDNTIDKATYQRSQLARCCGLCRGRSPKLRLQATKRAAVGSGLISSTECASSSFKQRNPHKTTVALPPPYIALLLRCGGAATALLVPGVLVDSRKRGFSKSGTGAVQGPLI